MQQAPLVVDTTIGNANFPNQKNVGGYILSQVLGSGAFGIVHLAERNGQTFAIKAYNFKAISSGINPEKVVELITNEIKALSSLSHPNIMKIYEYFRTSNNLYLVLQYCEHGDLLSWIEKNGPLSEKQVFHILPQLVDAFGQAASLKIMHRDIKPENLFLSDSKIIVGDFGLSKVDIEFTNSSLGTPTFMPPEQLHSLSYSFGTDVWALAVTLYMCLFGHDPWKRYSYKKSASDGKLRLYQLDCTKSIPINRTNSGAKLYFPPNSQISDFLKYIFSKMLDVNPTTRIDWSDLAKQLKNKSLVESQYQDSMLAKAQMIVGVSEKEEESQILNQIKIATTFQQNLINKMLECSEILNQVQINSTQQLSHMIESELNDPNASSLSSIISHINIDNCTANQASEEVVERYILYQLYLCQFQREVVFNLIDSINGIRGIEFMRGVVFLIVNLIEKKTRRIAAYFIQKLEQRFAQFTVIGKCTDFYQNGFAKQYLHRFQSLFTETEDIIGKTAIEVKKHLPLKYYRREIQIEWAAQVDQYELGEAEGFNYAVFNIFVGMDKVDPSVVQVLKCWIASLSLICRYEDCSVFLAQRDQLGEFNLMLRQLRNPWTLEELFEQNKEYFRQWKNNLNNNR